MKKLIVAAVLACAAIASQGSAVSWTASNLVDKNGVDLVDSTLGDFTAVLTIWAADGTTVLAENAGSVSALNGAVTGKWSGAALSTQYYAQLVLTDSQGNTLTSEKASFTTNTSATYKPNLTTGSGFDVATSKISTAASGWVAAPEPTSGLLLLLGVAGLALKRKRA